MYKFNHHPHLIKLFSAAAVWGIANYIPIFAKSLGITDTNIGLAASLYATAMLASAYIFGRLADTIGRRPFIITGLLLSFLSFVLYIYAKDFTSFLIVRVLNGVAISIQASALVAYAYDAGYKMGRLSSFEALGVTLGSIFAGAVSFYFDMILIFMASSLFFFAAFLVSLKLGDVSFKRIKTPAASLQILKRNMPIYISFFIRHSAANSIWVFWGLYLLQLGGSMFLIGVAMAINTLTQFIVMFVFTDKIKVKTMLPVGTLMSSVTFFAFGISSDIWQILAAQVLLGVSWAFLYVGSIRWITENTREKATGLGILNSVMNLSMLTGPVIATVAVGFGGYKTIMFVAAAIAFFGFLVFDLLSKRMAS